MELNTTESAAPAKIKSVEFSKVKDFKLIIKAWVQAKCVNHIMGCLICLVTSTKSITELHLWYVFVLTMFS